MSLQTVSTQHAAVPSCLPTHIPARHCTHALAYNAPACHAHATHHYPLPILTLCTPLTCLCPLKCICLSPFPLPPGTDYGLGKHPASSCPCGCKRRNQESVQHRTRINGSKRKLQQASQEGIRYCKIHRMHRTHRVHRLHRMHRMLCLVSG